jgi:hypothetical protein
VARRRRRRARARRRGPAALAEHRRPGQPRRDERHDHRAQPPRLLEIESDIHGVLRWELAGEHRATRLVFTVSVPAPNDAVTLLRAGWHIHLEHLADALDGRPVDWPRWDAEHRPRWQELHDAYEARAD